MDGAVLPAGAGESGFLPPLTVLRAFLAWQFDPYLAVVVVVLGGLYLYAASLLRRRGDHWSGWRTVLFVGLGLGLIVVATQSSMAVYDTTLFSAHMVQHMVLSMLVPVFLALGAPITLALRVLAGRPRSWLRAVLHSLPVRLASSPPVSLTLFAGSMVGLYFTPWYEATLRNTFLHEMQHVHFVLVGCLFFWPLVGTDPVPGRLPYLARMGVAFLAVPVHAALGIALMTMNTVVAADWYLGVHRLPWVDALGAQHAGGAILWATGDLINIVVAAAMFVQWVQADERRAARIDRHLDREEAHRDAEPAPGHREDDELAAYNAMLARLNRRDRAGP